MEREGGVTILRKAGFPATTATTTTITIKAKQPATFAFKIRVPAWAVGTNEVAVDGKQVPVPASAPGTHLTLSRQFRDGDVVEVCFPMSFFSARLQLQNMQMTRWMGPPTLCHDDLPRSRTTKHARKVSSDVTSSTATTTTASTHEKTHVCTPTARRCALLES